jgi:hypothetical protein
MMTPIKVAYLFFGGILILHAFIYWEAVATTTIGMATNIYIFMRVCVCCCPGGTEELSNYRTGGLDYY